MGLGFDKLSPEAKRAAFAHMDRAKAKRSGKKLGSGARHRAMSANKKAPAATGKAHEQLSSGYVKNKGASENDVAVLVARYRLMHGREPSPKQIAKIRRAR